MRSERPMFSSSSTIRILFDAIRQYQSERSPAQLSVYRQNVSARKQGAFARDRKPEPHAVLLERNCGLEQRLSGGLTQSWAGIVNLDRDLAVHHLSDGEHFSTGARRLRRVFQQVEEDALYQVFIGDRARRVFRQSHPV